MTQLVDIGVNFHSKQLADKHAGLFARARAAGVATILATGTSVQSSRQAHELAQGHPGVVYATAGIHPHKADSWDAGTAKSLASLWQSPLCVAVGECGLDYNRNFSTPENQRKAFKAQLEAAFVYKKPLFLHCRDAFEDFIRILAEFSVGGKTPLAGVVHCFTGTRAEAEQVIALGFDIGITGWVTDSKRGSALRDALAHIPLNRMHLETDAPYLAPQNLKVRGKFNEPANLPFVAQAIGQILGVSQEDVGRQCAENSRRMFGLAEVVLSV